MLQFVKRPAVRRVFFAFAALLIAGTAAAPAEAGWYHHGYWYHGGHYWHPYWGAHYWGPGYYAPGYVAAPGVYVGIR